MIKITYVTETHGVPFLPPRQARERVVEIDGRAHRMQGAPLPFAAMPPLPSSGGASGQDEALDLRAKVIASRALAMGCGTPG